MSSSSSKQQQQARAIAARLAADAKRQAPKAKSKGNTGVVAFAVLVGGAFFSIPFLTHWTKKENLTRKEEALNATQIRRGAYLNTGSKDAGVDKDWDFYTNTWRGRRADERKRADGSSAAAQDGTP